MENRISAYFSSDSEPLHSPQANAAATQADPRAAAHMVRGVDLYQAARARALFDCELNKLFNPEGDVE